MKKKIIALALGLLIATLGISACSEVKSQDIYVLFTGDVHCAANENIGYDGLAAYKNSLAKKSQYVTLVDTGDSLQGNYASTVSKGVFSIELMNEVGYDLAVLGNHEFDYGLSQLTSLMELSTADYLGCNINYSGSGTNALADLKPYEIITYGEVSVAYIGVSTPESIATSYPTYFMEDGEFVYDFTVGDNGQKLYTKVQGYIDECRTKGADYVVVLSHLGDETGSSPYTSYELVENTSGIDAILDGHAHSTIPCRILADKDGNEVLLSATGTKLTNIGQLVITASGNINVGLISDYSTKDEAVQAKVTEKLSTYELSLGQKVATSDFTLSLTDASGKRLVRVRETSIGNLCADAYRDASGADIAFANGGGIRANIDAGDITYSDIIAVFPYSNALCMVKATGQEILDALEFSVKDTQSTVEGGEFGGFLQVSGLKFTVNTAIPSSVTVDDNGMFTSVDGARRVSNVLVLSKSGDYVPLNATSEYTVASHNYTFKEQGDGYTMFVDNEYLIDESAYDYEVLINYIQSFADGKIAERYLTTEGRITVN